jgi:hypothetical protein
MLCRKMSLQIKLLLSFMPYMQLFDSVTYFLEVNFSDFNLRIFAPLVVTFVKFMIKLHFEVD